MRADSFLPDAFDQIDVGGVTIRKGTVAAFLANARVWSDPCASETARAEAAADIIDTLPGLRTTGIFDILEIRDAALSACIAAQWDAQRDAQSSVIPASEVRS